ncbi:MAG: alanine--tRNA ligase [bacterium]|nr:alanine--tRNA ligase [bacterium]
MKSADIRSTFISFFENKGHQYVPGSPIVPQNDPTLLFINAGMNQFKDVFLGTGTRDYTRAVNSQFCIRVSGKHNDLEEVGVDTYHHTLFEMLGNWSFGDFYKKEAIEWAWELLTDVFGMPKDKLYASVYETDDEADAIWRTNTDVNPAHILRCGDKDNFWEMGDTGPCGPCSELHIDLGPNACDKTDVEHVCAVNGICGRYVELWNLVFIQYNREPDGSLSDLPAKHVDTGAGLERITAYLQNTLSNYETDLFTPIIAHLERKTGRTYSAGSDGIPFRVIADHIRALVVSIADNVRPSNEGRGYVLRRVLRRALKYGQKLGLTEPFMFELVPIVGEIYGEFYAHISARADYISKMIKAEEESFLRTLTSGTHLFDELVNTLKEKGITQINGADAFKLYDTFGFPLDLTQLMAREHGFSVYESGFNAEMDAQRQRSRQVSEEASTDVVSATLTQGDGDAPAVNKGVYITAPGGGEARLPANDWERFYLACHHSATHLLNDALRHVLGPHVEQAGSLVDVDKLRFDFTHFEAITPEQLKQIDAYINKEIALNSTVEVFEKPLEEAKAMGAAAMFGEKYDDVVRVVKMGSRSLELCGGNHVSKTGDITVVKIISESSVAAGTRRIEAVAGEKAVAYFLDQMSNAMHDSLTKKIDQIGLLIEKMDAISEGASEKIRKDLTVVQARQNSGDVTALQDALVGLTGMYKQAEKELQKLQTQNSGAELESLKSAIKTSALTHTSVIGSVFEGYDIPRLKTLADTLLNYDANLIAILGSDNGFFVVKTPDAVAAPFRANALITQLTDIAGGKGGGKPSMAQAGGAQGDKVGAAITQVLAALESA